MAWKAAVLLTFILGVKVSAGAEGSCPEASLILPCVCVDYASLGPTMDCSGVEDEPQLAQVFAVNFSSTDFYELRITHDPENMSQRLSSLEATTLGQSTFERVVITGTQILTIDGYAFDRSKLTLRVLALDGNRINEFSFGSLARYSQLTSLLLAYNNLRLLPKILSETLEVVDVRGNIPLVIDSDAFTSSPSLIKINLANTGQQSLPLGLFSSLNNLQYLDLSDNELTELEMATIVTGAASVTFLDLSRNEISFVRHDSIIGLSSNGTLFMDTNHIELLTQESWQDIFEQLSPDGTISLAENPLVCGCDLKWVVQNDTYVSLLTDTTKCVSGEMVIFLDPNIFDIFCP